MVWRVGAMLAFASPAVLLAQQPSLDAAMAASAAGWNAGDLSAFMAVYADDAIYVTTKGVVRGKAAIAARYASTFREGGNSRGRLGFQTLATRELGPERRLMIARWTLTGAKVETGLTTLVFERRGTRWMIVADHSS